MIFDYTTDKEQFDLFVKNHPTKSHFMQSVGYGELCEKAKGQTAYYTSLKDDDGNIKAAALLLYNKPSLFPGYFYCPRGFVIDFNDNQLLDEFIKKVAAFAKLKKVMSITIDPDIERWDISKDGKPIDQSKQNPLHQTLLSYGFVHGGYNLGFEKNLPRFSFRIDLTPEQDFVMKRVDNQITKAVRKGETYPSDVSIGNSENIEDFYRLIKATGERDNFFSYSKSYYQHFYDTLAAHDMAKIFVGKVYPKEIKLSLEQKLLQNEKRLETLVKPNLINEAVATKARLEKELVAYETKASKFPESYITSAHIIVCYGKHSWAVHAGSDNAFTETFINKRVYLKKMLFCKQNNSVWLDQFGTIGDPENHKLKSLHEFKKQYGGRYVEFIGEYDLPINKPAYLAYKKIFPAYRYLRFTAKEILQKIKGV